YFIFSTHRTKRVVHLLNISLKINIIKGAYPIFPKKVGSHKFFSYGGYKSLKLLIVEITFLYCTNERNLYILKIQNIH
ncbi:hypothetical protein, partial [Priestia megaterium]